LSCLARQSHPIEISDIDFNGEREMKFYVCFVITIATGSTQMTNIKTLSAAIILCAAVATPVFAQDAVTIGPKAAPTHHVRAHTRNYRGAYNQVNEPAYAAPRGRDPFGFDGTEEYPRLLYSGN
jgi:hypothetical protein